jgi:molecular chaperone GrpE
MSKWDDQHKDQEQKSWAEHIEADTENQQQSSEQTQQQESQAQQSEPDEQMLSHPSYQQLEQKLTEAEQRAQDYWNKALRAQAEKDNFRQRMEKELNEARKYALEPFVKELLAVIDSLENGLSQVPEDQHEAREGLKLTLDKMIKILNEFGVDQLDPQGEAFNPEYHEAMSTQQTDEVPVNQVVQVLQKGYTLNQRLVRPALVIVAKPQS